MVDWKTKAVLVLLLVALVANTVVHFTHPAYREYREVSKSLRSDYAKFTNRVQSEFVPSIFAVVTNAPPSSLSVDHSSTNSVSSAESSGEDQLPDCLAGARYFVSSGAPMFEWQGSLFEIGGDLFGHVILDVRPTVVITTGRVFLLSPVKDVFKRKGGAK